jgi:hypothetical protein
VSGDQQTRRPIKVVLDASAVVEFTRESVHVGELLAEIDDEEGAAAIPLSCLVEAVHAVADTDRLNLLVGHRATVVIADAPADWQVLAATNNIVGRVDAASAALTALDNNGCAVLTRYPGLYAGMEAGGLTITIEE